MWGTDYFQVIHGEPEMIGEFAITAVAPIGTFVDDDGSNAQAELANGNALGFMTKEVTADGPTFEQMNFQNCLVAKAGDAVSIGALCPGHQIEVENEPSKTSTGTGAKMMVTSGTGAITAATAKDTEVSVVNGRLYAAQTGDRVMFRVLNAAITPHVTGTNIRVRMERVAGGLKP